MKTVLGISGIFIFSYLAFVFIATSFDIRKWEIEERAACIMLATFVSVIISSATYINSEQKENKPTE